MCRQVGFHEIQVVKYWTVAAPTTCWTVAAPPQQIFFRFFRKFLFSFSDVEDESLTPVKSSSTPVLEEVVDSFSRGNKADKSFKGESLLPFKDESPLPFKGFHVDLPHGGESGINTAVPVSGVVTATAGARESGVVGAPIRKKKRQVSLSKQGERLSHGRTDLRLALFWKGLLWTLSLPLSLSLSMPLSLFEYRGVVLLVLSFMIRFRSSK
jgi:hypothetical protein